MLADARQEITYYDAIVSHTKELIQLQELKESGVDVCRYIPTGIACWDEAGGTQRGVLTITAGGSGEGKSVVKLHLARAAAQAGFSVLLMDFEDPMAKTVERTLAGITGLDSKRIGRLQLSDMEQRQVKEAAKSCKEWGKLITFHEHLDSVPEIMSIIERSEHDLVIIDYAQILPDVKGEERERMLSNFAKFIAADAKAKNRGMRLFSQIKPAVEERGHKRFDWSRKKDISGFCPVGISDIAWSSAFGQLAKVVELLWRPGRCAVKLGVAGQEGCPDRDDELWVVLAKVSFGEEGRLVLHWDGETSTIRDT